MTTNPAALTVLARSWGHAMSKMEDALITVTVMQLLQKVRHIQAANTTKSLVFLSMRIFNVVARMNFHSFKTTIVSMRGENVFPSTGYVTGAFHVMMVRMSQNPVRNGFVHKTSSSVTTITALDCIHFAIISMNVMK